MYYLRVNGSVYGPYTDEQIQGYIAERRVVPENEISTDGTNWQTAGNNPVLFPQGNFQPPMPEFINGGFSVDPNVSFWNCYINCWKRYTDFSGRSRRKEYWAWSFYNILLMMLLFLLLIPLMVMADGSQDLPVVCTILGLGGIAGILVFGLAAFVPGIAVLVRRLHDIGQPGWWAVLILGSQFVPGLNFAGSIALIVIACIDGQPGINRFGPNPKGR